MSDEQPSLVRRWFSGTYNILAEKGALSFYRTVDDVPQLVLQGILEALYEYIVKFCIQALPQFVLEHQVGLVRHPGRLGTFSENLRSFRLTRAVQKGIGPLGVLWAGGP